MDAKRGVGLAGFADAVREEAADAPRDSADGRAVRMAGLLEDELRLAELGLSDERVMDAMVGAVVSFTSSSQRLKPLLTRYGLVQRRERMVPPLIRKARPRAPRRRSVRAGVSRRGPPASSSEDDPEPSSSAWIDVAVASERMVAHERRREARWRKGVPA